MTLKSLVCSGIVCAMFAASAAAATPSFKDFDRRAAKGERLNVVFFGASLTWGANATDPQNTSYRAQFGDWLEQKYPKARFKLWDAAIGGTGSQLGVFRFDRDVLRRKPDLVLIDFSANDDIHSNDPENAASYESLVRRTILDANAPAIIVIFPFQWNVQAGNTDGMNRRLQHIEIANAYNVPVGDAITLCQQRVKDNKVTIPEIWPSDGVHPGNVGYGLFAEAAAQAFEQGVKNKMQCKAPAKMLFADTCMKNARVRISTLTPLPEGWKAGVPNLTAAWYDGLMSRWLDDVVIASNTKADDKTVAPARLKVKINASLV
ncbi:MAG TPA: SGNH/GDSL hydrolase family protein, partial [Planctomycetota bacterium]|nr:SGNH/GDSL hydrolase family protein [Planctomycetota bacterium]